jgi:hypothetical protein
VEGFGFSKKLQLAEAVDPQRATAVKAVNLRRTPQIGERSGVGVN